MSNGERIIKNGDIEICTESFGNRQDPAILLIMGATASMLWWEEEFCEKLAVKGRFVIRFDNRDVGKSTTYPPGTINYDVLDMLNDAFNVLDAYKIDKAHFTGMSLGGMLAQLAALLKPERVLTLTIISSSVWDDRPDLPATLDEVIAFHKKGEFVNWSNEEEVVEYMVSGSEMLNGSAHPFDKKRSRRLAVSEFRRARNLLSMFNHALLKGGEEFYGSSKEIKKPVLIIHGTEDPILPYPHALALKETIAGAELLSLKGSGHEIHHLDWDIIIDSIQKHSG